MNLRNHIRFDWLGVLTFNFNTKYIGNPFWATYILKIEQGKEYKCSLNKETK